MKTEIEFRDPFFTSALKEEKNGLIISYPLADEKNVKEAASQIRLNAAKYFSSHSVEDIQKLSDEIDSSFNDLTTPDNVKLIELIQRSSGFSKYDIEHWGLGLFRSIAGYDRGDKRILY